MRFKTILIIFCSVIITIFLMINTDAVEFNLIFTTMDVSKLLVIGICTVIGFILGYAVGRPRTVVSTYDDRFDPGEANSKGGSTLSDEDKEYIS
jgi:putative membrane protein